MLLGEECLKSPVDHLGNGHTVPVRLASDRLNLPAFDMEGDALRLLTGIAGMSQGGLTLLPPGHQFLQGRDETDNHLTARPTAQR